jgi:hypothetical protein
MSFAIGAAPSLLPSLILRCEVYRNSLNHNPLASEPSLQHSSSAPTRQHPKVTQFFLLIVLIGLGPVVSDPEERSSGP